MKIMRKFIMWSVAGSILILSVSVAVASWLGKDADTEIVTTLSYSQQRRNDRSSMIQFIDLRRRLKVTFLPDTEHPMYNMRLHGPHHVLALTQPQVDNPVRRTSINLRYVDLRPHATQSAPITTFSNVNQREIANVDSLEPHWSPDGRQVAFYARGFVHVYDTQTQESWSIPNATFVDSGHLGYRMAWSPDGRHIALRRRSDILVVDNHDGSSERLYRLPSAAETNPSVWPFTPYWSNDSQYLVLRDPNETAFAVLIIDGGTMQAQTILTTIPGGSFPYPGWCNNRWIAITGRQPNGLVTPHVLDTADGILYNLKDHPLLADRLMFSMSVNENCEYALLNMGLDPPPADPFRAQFSLFVSDMTGSDVRLIDEPVLLNWAEQNGNLYYVVADASGEHTIYCVSLDDPSQKEQVARFLPDDRLTAGYSLTWFEDPNYGLIHTANYAALYLVDSSGLHPLSPPGDTVSQFAIWPES